LGRYGTQWGRQRIADGHPAPYNVTHFELGNEGDNPRFLDQVKAMEARAAQVGMNETLHYYLSPGPSGHDYPDAALIEQSQALGLGDRLAWDIHVGPPPGENAVESADIFLTNASSWAAMNLETNFGSHTVDRMLQEAKVLNTFFVYANSRLKGRTASFCMERSGYNEGGVADQGLAFYLPNMTWLQPPAHVHAMISETWQPLAIDYSVSADCGNLDNGTISVQTSEDGRTVAVRIVNESPASRTFFIDVGHHAELMVRSISFPDKAAANTPANPQLIVPTQPRVVQNQTVELPGYSYSVFVSTRTSVGEVVI